MSDKPSREIEIHDLFARVADYYEREGGSGDVDAGWERLARIVEQKRADRIDQRNDIIKSGRRRWGSGSKLTTNAESGEWTEVVDGHGDMVPREDWEAFRAYLDAERQDRSDMIRNSRWP